MNWFSPKEFPPTPFVSVLVYTPIEDPMPTVHEGFIDEDKVWHIRGLRYAFEEVEKWAEMPLPPDQELVNTVVVNRHALVHKLQSIHKQGFVDGYVACREKLEGIETSGMFKIENLPIFTEEMLAENAEELFSTLDKTNRAAVVMTDSGKILLAFNWEDYMERFGALYSEEDLCNMRKVFDDCISSHQT